jgi:hypothetical protein
MTMNPSQARVIDPILTKIMQGYRDQKLVGEALFPRVPVTAAGGKILEFGKEAFLAYNTQRAPGTATRRVTFGYSGKPYALENHALEAPVPREHQRDAKEVPGVDLAQRSTNLVMGIMLKGLEVQQAGLATDAANYDVNHKVTLAGGDKWSAAGTSDPLGDIRAAKEAIRSTVGTYPNVMLLSAVAFKALQDHAQLTDKIKYTQRGILTPELIAAVFDLEKVVVGGAVKAADDGTFSDVWGNNAILAYVPSIPQSMEEPSYGYTYTMEGHPFVEQPYWDPNAKSWIYGVAFERAPVIAGMQAGYLIQAPN